MDNAVEFYAVGRINMRICFPHGKVDCRHCRFCRHKEAYGLFQCALTDDYIEKYQLDERHENCPVELDDTPF